MSGMEGLHPDVIGDVIQSQAANNSLMAFDSTFFTGSLDSLLATGKTVEGPVKSGAMSNPKILTIFLASLAGFTGLFVLMLKQRIDLVNLKIKIKQLEK